MDTETRTADLWPDAELRASPDGFGFEGYAAVFDTPSVRMAFPGVNGGKPFREVIHRGAFAKSLAEAPAISLLWQHDASGVPLASTRNGSLALEEDDRGLHTSGTLPDDELGRPIRNALADGRVGGMSFRFQKVIDRFSTDGGETIRHLHEVRLHREVSITDTPAYPATTAGVRSDPNGAEPPVVWLTAGDMRALHIEDRAPAPVGSAAACCDACTIDGTGACCADGTCPAGCTGCPDCADGNPPFGARQEPPADPSPTLAERRARLDALR